MRVDDELKALDFKGRDFPLLRGDVKLTLKNVHNGKTETREHHNVVTNALAHIFAGNYGGLLNYENFADLYRTYLGGVLLFHDALDDTALNDYGIPANTSNALVAHAGQTRMESQADDLTRGNPDDTGTTLQAGSTKLTFEWGTSAGNGVISSLGLTHSDVGSYGCGINSEAQKLLNPFANVGFYANRSYQYADNPNNCMSIDGNMAYSFYIVDDTTVNVYCAPINCTKYKLQGGSLKPILGATATPYYKKITVTLGADFNFNGAGCYYHFDHSAHTLTIFGVVTEGGNTLYKDVIDISSTAFNTATQNATHSSFTVGDAKLWKFRVYAPLSGYYNVQVPTKAIVYNGYLFVYAYDTNTGGNLAKPNTIYKVNLSNAADFSEIDCSYFSDFAPDPQSRARANERFAQLGGIIVHDSFLINSDVVYPTNSVITDYRDSLVCANENAISSPVFAMSSQADHITANCIAINKLYLATKFNLSSAVQKSASQSMTVEYTLTEV